MADVLTVDDSGNITASGDITAANLSGTNTGDQSDATLNFSDITTNNSSTSQHGFLKKLDSNSAHYMDGTGSWSTPPAPGLATTSTAGIVKPDGSTIDVSSGVISVPTATTGAVGLVEPDGVTVGVSAGVISTLNAGQFSGSVNKFRNPKFDVAQRGTSGTAGEGVIYAPDGWYLGGVGEVEITWTVENGTDFNGTMSAYLKYTGASPNTGTLLYQRIESMDAALLAGQTVTVQFYLQNNSGASVTPTVATLYAFGVDNWTEGNADLSTTNMQTIPNGSSGVCAYTFNVSAYAYEGYEFQFNFGAVPSGSDTISVSGFDVRVTPGVATGLNSSPPTPEFLPIAIELPRNYRYLGGFGETTGIVGLAYATSSTAFGVYIPFKNKMRIAPTGITVDTVGDLEIVSMAGSNVAAVSGLSFGNASEDGIFLTGTVASGLSSGTVYQLKVATALAGNVIFTGAEL
jgi:hypothetical protein